MRTGRGKTSAGVMFMILIMLETDEYTFGDFIIIIQFLIGHFKTRIDM